MVKGEEKLSSEPEGTASIYDAAGNCQALSSNHDDNDNDTLLDKLSIPHNLPSILDIKRALPQYVFDSPVSTSVYYAIKDIVQIVAMFVVAESVWSSGLLPTWILLLLLPAYWFLQGTFFAALFVIGHEGSHNSFSNYKWLNNIVGNVCHSFVFCPYYCWTLLHRHHHKNTCNMDKDEIFYPIRKKEFTGKYTLPGFGLFMGWFGYLLLGYGSRPVGHFNPWHPKLRRHVFHCLLSIALVVAWAAVLWEYALEAGFLKLLVHYVVPDFVFASYTVVVTFLHHTEEDVPWYDDSLWDNVRGQLSSVDRHYGWCHNILHSIGTHQIHHLFPRIPHYHLEEATRVFRRKFPQLVQVRTDPILPAFWRMFCKYTEQHVVSDSAKVHWYK